MSALIEKLHEIHDALSRSGLAHAFGGAIALGYCTEEPRGTRDIDVNIFVVAEQAERAAAALPVGIVATAGNVKALRESGQARLWWDGTPIDIFLNNHSFHEEVARGVRWVPLEGREIPVLGCEALTIFKAVFDRAKDWADIEMINERDHAVVVAAADKLQALTGDANDPAVARLRALPDSPEPPVALSDRIPEP